MLSLARKCVCMATTIGAFAETVAHKWIYESIKSVYHLELNFMWISFSRHLHTLPPLPYMKNAFRFHFSASLFAATKYRSLDSRIEKMGDIVGSRRSFYICFDVETSFDDWFIVEFIRFYHHKKRKIFLTWIDYLSFLLFIHFALFFFFGWIFIANDDANAVN